MADYYYDINIKLNKKLPIQKIDNLFTEIFLLPLFLGSNYGKKFNKPVKDEYENGQYINEYFVENFEGNEYPFESWLMAIYYIENENQGLQTDIVSLGPYNHPGRDLITNFDRQITECIIDIFKQNGIEATIIYTIDSCEESPIIFKEILKGSNKEILKKYNVQYIL